LRLLPTFLRILALAPGTLAALAAECPVARARGPWLCRIAAEKAIR
jgi:hypothetical protein